MVKNFFQMLSLFLKRAFCCFSLVTVTMALVGSVADNNEFSNYISVDLIVSFFLFSLLFALSFGISDFIGNNSILRRFVQFILTYLSVALVFFAGGAFDNYVEVSGVQNKGFSILAISFVFVLIYIICGVFSLVVSAIKKKVSENNKGYDKMFENK